MTKTQALREPAEIQFASELAALAAIDTRERPPQWRLSPWAVLTYVMGGTLEDGTIISPKYVGNRRLIEIAVATLATDRALLLLGVPGTAKSWVSEHISPPRSAATRRSSFRGPPARPRKRSATAGTTRSCSPRARRSRPSCRARSCAA